MSEEEQNLTPFDGELVAHIKADPDQSMFCPFYRQVYGEWQGGFPYQTKKEALESVQWVAESGGEIRIYEIKLPKR